MTDPERIWGREWASEADLSDLFYSAAAWLSIDGNGIPGQDNTSQTLGYRPQDGTPITHDHPYVEFTVAGDTIRDLLPQAAARLEIGDSFTVRLNNEFLSPHVFGAPLYLRQNAACLFDVQKAPGATTASDTVFVEQYRMPGRPDRWEVARMTDTPEGGDRVVHDTEMLAAEYAALQLIVDNLDALKAAQEASPPPAVAPE